LKKFIEYIIDNILEKRTCDKNVDIRYTAGEIASNIFNKDPTLI